MKQWTITDKAGHEIYLTDERWGHIVSKHSELRAHREDVLDTIRLGRRKQTKRDPRSYCYYRRVTNLRPPYNAIVVLVAFRYHAVREAEPLPNNFVVTAWGDVYTAAIGGA
jgi:hypothetical protein